MRLALVTAWDATYQPIADITVPHMEAYCAQHGYEFRPFPDRFHFNPDDLLTYGDRVKLQIFKDLYADYDAIAWLDVDCLITNPRVMLHEWAERQPFTWTYDPMGPLSGFWIARCVPEVHLFLHAVQHKAVEMQSARAPYGESDQTAMRALMNLPPFAAVASRPVSCKQAGHCFPAAEYGWTMYADLVAWEPGDFVFTVPSLPLELRIDLLLSATGKEAVTALASWDARVHGEDSSHPTPFFRPGSRDRDIWQACFVENEYALGELQPADRVVDIGMHVGAFCCLAYVKGSRRIEGFEPDHTAWEAAARNTGAFGADIVPFNLAVVGNAFKGETVRYDPGTMQVSDTGSHAAHIVLIDAILDGPIRVLKLDCEGWEWPILYSSRKLHLVDEIVGEFHGEGMGALARYLADSWGYQVAWHRTGANIGNFRAVRS